MPCARETPCGCERIAPPRVPGAVAFDAARASRLLRRGARSYSALTSSGTAVNRSATRP